MEVKDFGEIYEEGSGPDCHEEDYSDSWYWLNSKYNKNSGTKPKEDTINHLTDGIYAVKIGSKKYKWAITPYQNQWFYFEADEVKKIEEGESLGYINNSWVIPIPNSYDFIVMGHEDD